MNKWRGCVDHGPMAFNPASFTQRILHLVQDESRPLRGEVLQITVKLGIFCGLFLVRDCYGLNLNCKYKVCVFTV